MALSNDLASQFVKATMDKKETNKESTAYGKIVTENGKEYVQLDGSELLTPISTTTVVNNGDRVMVTIKNHEAIVTGDLTNPSASDKEVKEIGSKISEFEIVIADKVSTEQLEAEVARIDKLVTDEITATNVKVETIEGKVAEIDTIKADVVEVEGKVTAQEAEFTTLRSDIADFKDVTAESIESIEGDFYNLSSEYAEFEQTMTNKMTANEASITKLETDKLSVENANATYAQINFANITEAAVQKLFADSGIIRDLIMSEGKVTGELVGVTIKGDLIEAGTLKADKLIIKGENGLYYKLNMEGGSTVTEEITEEDLQNGLDGRNIIAKSITAGKIAVDDLAAFEARIGGFIIDNNTIYSGEKISVDSESVGICLDSEGQIAAGDASEFLKYYKEIDDDGIEHRYLEISASSISLGTSIEQQVTEPLINEETGEPVMREALDESGNPILDENENPVMEPVIVPKLDEYGNPIIEIVRKDLDLKSISDTVTLLETNSEGIKTTVAEMSDDIGGLRNSVESKLSASEVELTIKSELKNFSASKVETSTGFKFDETGLTIAKSGKDVSTNINEDGMSIYKSNNNEVLTVDNRGVTAYNLHARTYLIIGDTSRFEDFVKNGKKRTGCFWIG